MKRLLTENRAPLRLTPALLLIAGKTVWTIFA